MSYLALKHKLKRFFKRRRNRKYINVLVKRERAEVTIETAIVFTIIMILIGSMIYFGLFLHDKVAIKSYAYSGLVEGADKDDAKCKELVNAKINKAPVFVIRPTFSVSEDFNKYKCNIKESDKRTMNYLDQLFNFTMGNQEVEAVKKMPIDKMYLVKAVKDGLGK